jgi:flavodoxin
VEVKMKALIIYWSATGNTEKVAVAIENGLAGCDIEVTKTVVADADNYDFYNYDLVFLGSPTYMFMPPDPVNKFIKDKLKMHSGRGDIKLKSPKLPGKKAIVFVTYSGPHTGINEAVPVGKYIGQMFEHIGFEVEEWYIASEFHGRERLSLDGALGDIRGKPDAQDLAKIEQNVRDLAQSICV